MITHTVVSVQGHFPPREAVNAARGGTFNITDTKLYVPVVTLSTQDDNYQSNKKQNFKQLLNGINTDQKCLFRPKLTI